MTDFWKSLTLFLCFSSCSLSAVAQEHLTPCVGGVAGGFSCDRVDLLEHMPLATIGGGSGNDIWGWTDPVTGIEYALMGISSGTAIVDLADPENPVYMGHLPTETSNSPWRDMKTYRDHLFVVSEAGGHGMQVFDLTQLRTPPPAPAIFSADAVYTDFGGAHNIVINEDSGFAYAVGTSTCSGGLHMIDISAPLTPVFAGCFSSDGYTHDAQCVNYRGPDADHLGKEICLNSNEDTITIVDVTAKATPVQLSRTGYAGSGYTHQGWLTDDHAHFLLDDETDELGNGHNTHTYIWDLADLDAPQLISTYIGPVASSDHNLYVKGQFGYQANYRSGLRVLDLSDVAAGSLAEVGFFDTYPADDNAGTQGAWSVYPYFESGTVVVSDIQSGLFVLRPITCTAPAAPATLTATPAGDNRIDLAWPGGAAGETYSVYRSFGACPAGSGGTVERIASGLTAPAFSDTTASGQVAYSYFVTTSDATGFCESVAGLCASTTTTGICNAPPLFTGVVDAVNQASAACAVDVSWDPATPNCGPSVTYSVYRGNDAAFLPSPATRIAEGLTATGWTDGGAVSGQPHHYIVRATDTGNGAEETNLSVRQATATGPISDGTFLTGAEIGDPAMASSTPASSSTLAAEAGGAGGPEHIGWELSTARSRSGARSFFSTYVNDQCSALVSPPLALTAGQVSSLSFWTAYEIENQWDGGVIQISTDGGQSWSLLNLDQGYPGLFRSSTDACGFSDGDPAITDVDLTWGELTADLSAWAGSEILLRWIFSTDGGLTLEGWYVDDIDVSHVQVAGSCVSDSLFFDGFETGDFTRWSAVTP